MLTATIQRPRAPAKLRRRSWAPASWCRTTVGDSPQMLASDPATTRAWSLLEATTRPPASGWPAARTRVSCSIGLAEDPRQPLGKVGRDRGPVAPAPLAGREILVEGALDRLLAALPDQRAVEGDEDHPPAGAVADRLGVGVGDVGDGEPVAVVGDARDRRVVAAKRRPREQQGAPGRSQGPGEARSPGELVTEVVDLVGDHERPRRAVACIGAAEEATRA